MADEKTNKNLRKPFQRDAPGQHHPLRVGIPVREVEEVIHDGGSENIDREEVPEHSVCLQHLQAVPEWRGREAFHLQFGIDPVLHRVAMESQTTRGNDTSSKKRASYQFSSPAILESILNSRLTAASGLLLFCPFDGPDPLCVVKRRACLSQPSSYNHCSRVFS